MLKQIKLNSFTDERGTLSVLEFKDYVDWEVKRAYYLTDAKLPRGAHAVKGEKKFYICQQGTFSCKFHDGKQWHEFKLEGPSDAIIMEGFCYREFFDFSPGSVLLALSSLEYDPDTYVYDFEEFLKIANQ